MARFDGEGNDEAEGKTIAPLAVQPQTEFADSVLAYR